jgi:hypothetical protein
MNVAIHNLAEQGGGPQSPNRKLLLALFSMVAIFSIQTEAAVVFEYYASDWAGPNNSWNSRTGGQSLFYDTFNGSAPQKGSSTIAGVPVVTAVFDGNDFLTSPFVVGRPWAGLKQFSLSLVFKSNAPGPQTQTNIDAFWNQRGILGFELGGGGQGEFAIGLYNDGSPNGAVAASTGLGSGDKGTSAGNINDNNWHTLTMVVKDEGSGFFRQSVYVDGSLLNNSSLLQYGAVGKLADASFALGSIRGSASSERFVGEVAALRFDDTPFATSEVATLHSTYLGVIPEPSTSMLIGFGAISLFAIRRWQRHSKKSQIIHPLP